MLEMNSFRSLKLKLHTRHSTNFVNNLVLKSDSAEASPAEESDDLSESSSPETNYNLKYDMSSTCNQSLEAFYSNDVLLRNRLYHSNYFNQISHDLNLISTFESRLHRQNRSYEDILAFLHNFVNHQFNKIDYKRSLISPPSDGIKQPSNLFSPISLASGQIHNEKKQRNMQLISATAIFHQLNNQHNFKPNAQNTDCDKSVYIEADKEGKKASLNDSCDSTEGKSHRDRNKKKDIFKCKYCDKLFFYRCHLNVHERVHTKETPFGCDKCSAKFSQLGSLTVHKRIHTKAKPYQCEICFRKFRHVNSHKRHVRQVHECKKQYGDVHLLKKSKRSLESRNTKNKPVSSSANLVSNSFLRKFMKTKPISFNGFYMTAKYPYSVAMPTFPKPNSKVVCKQEPSTLADAFVLQSCPVPPVNDRMTNFTPTAFLQAQKKIDTTIYIPTHLQQENFSGPGVDDNASTNRKKNR